MTGLEVIGVVSLVLTAVSLAIWLIYILFSHGEEIKSLKTDIEYLREKKESLQGDYWSLRDDISDLKKQKAGTS